MGHLRTSEQKPSHTQPPLTTELKPQLPHQRS